MASARTYAHSLTYLQTCLSAQKVCEIKRETDARVLRRRRVKCEIDFHEEGDQRRCVQQGLHPRVEEARVAEVLETRLSKE